MAVRALVFDVGDEVCGWGRLVRTGDGDWFDPPLPVDWIDYGPAGAPAPVPSSLAVRAQGADFDAVEQRYERDGAIEGYAMVWGQWLGDGLRILRQSTEQPAPASRPPLVDPPCSPPPGGWPRGMNGRSMYNLEFWPGNLQESGAAVTLVTFRPGPDQAVLVVAATDADEVERQLRPQLTDRLCIVPSRWSRPLVDQVRDHLLAEAESWRVFFVGEGADEHAQATIEARLTHITTEIADWADSMPDGLLELRPWLSPVAPRSAG